MANNPKDSYLDLADWADSSNPPDSDEFDSLLSSLISLILKDVISKAKWGVRIQTRSEEHGKHAVIDFLEEYVGNKEYERFFTSD